MANNINVSVTDDKNKKDKALENKLKEMWQQRMHKWGDQVFFKAHLVKRKKSFQLSYRVIFNGVAFGQDLESPSILALDKQANVAVRDRLYSQRKAHRQNSQILADILALV